MKYVAFLDILGFKDYISSLPHSGAISYVNKFSRVVNDIVHKKEFEKINCIIVSDSIILSVDCDDSTSLQLMFDLIDAICRAELLENGILIRGGLAKGDFNSETLIEYQHFQNNIVVGQAYIEAYLLESSQKIIGIILSKSVYEDYQEYINTLNENRVLSIKENVFVFRYLTLKFFENENNLKAFVGLAIQSNWLPHYYNALENALLQVENADIRIEKLFARIDHLVYPEHSEWRKMDVYISNAFSSDVLPPFVTRFLKHIRTNMFSPDKTGN